MIGRRPRAAAGPRAPRLGLFDGGDGSANRGARRAPGNTPAEPEFVRFSVTAPAALTVVPITAADRIMRL